METIDHGVCRLSVVPVRQEPAHTSELVTQLLFGDHYEVSERSTNGKWLKIRNHFDLYAGWIDSKQHHGINREYFQYFSDAEFKITTDISSTLLYNKAPLTVLMGSVIPISSTELFKMEEQFAFNGEAKNLGQKREYEFLKATALKYLNAPYLWGGRTPFGIDCSGFTQMVFRICGYQLMRDAFQQSSQGKPVNSLAESKPGDLAFFSNDNNKISHTGIVIGADKIIHASGRVRIDSLDDKGIRGSDPTFYTHNLSHIRRILPD